MSHCDGTCDDCILRASLAAVTAENADLKRDLDGARHANDVERGAWSKAWAILTGESEYGAHSDEAIVRAAKSVVDTTKALRVMESRISGILCDAGGVVDPLPDGVAALLAERDDAREIAKHLKESVDELEAGLIQAGMPAIDDRANAAIFKDRARHLDDALLAAGNLARALERRAADLAEQLAAIRASILKRSQVPGEQSVLAMVGAVIDERDSWATTARDLGNQCSRISGTLMDAGSVIVDPLPEGVAALLTERNTLKRLHTEVVADLDAYGAKFVELQALVDCATGFSFPHCKIVGDADYAELTNYKCKDDLSDEREHFDSMRTALARASELAEKGRAK